MHLYVYLSLHPSIHASIYPSIRLSIHAEGALLSDSSDDENRPLVEDLSADPESNVDHYIAVLVESLSLLKRIPEAVDVSSPSWFPLEEKIQFQIPRISC